MLVVTSFALSGIMQLRATTYVMNDILAHNHEWDLGANIVTCGVYCIFTFSVFIGNARKVVVKPLKDYSILRALTS